MKTQLLLLAIGLAVTMAADEIAWTYTVENGQDAKLYCNDSDPWHETEPGNVLIWTREDKMEIHPDPKKYEFEQEDDVDKIYLIVKNVQPEDYGLYHCNVHNDRKTYKFVIRKGVNLGGPLYADLIDKYRENLIVGIIAAAVLLGMLLVFCFVYHFRYRESEDEKTYNVQRNNYFDADYPKAEHAFDNPIVYVEEDDHMTKDTIELEEHSTGANGYDNTAIQMETY